MRWDFWLCEHSVLDECFQNGLVLYGATVLSVHLFLVPYKMNTLGLRSAAPKRSYALEVRPERRDFFRAVVHD